MKLVSVAASGCLLLGSLVWKPADDSAVGQTSRKNDELTLIITGNASGHLAPCGCTKPMSGGMNRLATLVRQYRSQGNTLWLDTGSISGGGGRQEQMKVETYSELLGNLKVDVVAFAGSDATNGASMLTAGKSLSKASWIGDPAGLPSGLLTSTIKKGPFTFKAVADSKSVLVSTPKSSIEVFHSDGTANASGKRMTPGSHLRGILVVKFKNGLFVESRAIPLESRIAADRTAERIYKTYVARVERAGLIDQMPRTDEAEYVGSGKCASCHTQAAKIHFNSAHSKAYTTLKNDGHSKDPDCVGCHVVGVTSTKGFWADKTPIFEEVGCESCHGSGKAHSDEPRAIKMGKVGEKSCQKCHTPNTSPNFNFLTNWSKIRH